VVARMEMLIIFPQKRVDLSRAQHAMAVIPKVLPANLSSDPSRVQLRLPTSRMISGEPLKIWGVTVPKSTVSVASRQKENVVALKGISRVYMLEAGVPWNGVAPWLHLGPAACPAPDTLLPCRPHPADRGFRKARVWSQRVAPSVCMHDRL